MRNISLRAAPNVQHACRMSAPVINRKIVLRNI